MVPGSSILAAGQDFQVSVSPAFLNEITTSASGTTSSSAVVSAVGGSGSYSYTWTYLSGSTDISVLSPSSASTSFDFNFSRNGFFSASFQCEVDDGTNTETVFVAVSISYE